MSTEPERKFKGVWIPRDVWDSEVITLFQKCLWANINSLGNEDDPCYASNEWLAEKMGSTANYVANAISTLRKLGFVTDGKFNGRRRQLLAVLPPFNVKAALTLELRQGSPQGEGSINPGVKNRWDSIIEENKGERKDEIPAMPPEARYWNSMPNIRKIKNWSKNRGAKLKSRLKDAFFSANWKAAMDAVGNSTFCCGVNERGWMADFDWFLRPDTITKIMEGKYDNSPQRRDPTPDEWEASWTEQPTTPTPL